MSKIKVKDGTEIYYKDWGTGQPIVFHHGWPLSSDDWDNQMLFFLSHGYRVVAHDRRGHGRSTQTSDGHDMDTYAADASAVAEALDLRNAIHIGHSTGGGEVARYVAKYGQPQGRQQGESVKERARSLEERVLEGVREVEQRERETLYRLARAIEYRDCGTGLHLLRMSHYAEVLAEALGMSEDEVAILTSAAPLHDIGKIGIPDAVLLKHASLTDEEMAVMRRHPLIGYDILRDSKSKFVQMGALIALRHHERWDGSGYPDGLKGEEIPLPARIVATADVFDALTSERPYKRAWTSEEAFDYMKAHRGTLFDPSCVDALMANEARILDILNAKLEPPGEG